jgi:hypothetical protein
MERQHPRSRQPGRPDHQRRLALVLAIPANDALGGQARQRPRPQTLVHALGQGRKLILEMGTREQEAQIRRLTRQTGLNLCD